MKLLTRDTDYAVRALCFIARMDNKVVPVPELVRELDVPRPFLRKILQILHKKGILYSFKGKGGGFSLAKPPDKILITDLIKIFQNSLKLNECILKKRICPNKGACSLRRKIDGIEKIVAKELSSITVKSLI
ncbi:MAG: Rrf2 family transcriptional regulator [Candidatus Omnitrophota bacterium]|jgi:Rrf2 family protein|nr:MAG: Rrf2 family transcriptional regulator [Candidatus Omnitrophota bacterium]